MDALIVKEFTTRFIPGEKEHVLWLKKVQEAMEVMDTTPCKIDLIINQNPMKVKFNQKDMMGWVHVHFALAFVYTKAVLKGKAWIPPK